MRGREGGVQLLLVQATRVALSMESLKTTTQTKISLHFVFTLH